MAKVKKAGTSNVAAIIMNNIESLRLQRRWSREEVAARLHINRSTYDNYASGRTIPQLDILDHASCVFKLPAKVLCVPIEAQLKSCYE